MPKPARRRSNRRLKRQKKIKTPPKRGFHWVLLLVFSIIIFGWIYLYSSKDFWDGKNPVSVVIRNGDGILITNFNPNSEEIVKVYIPGNTRANVARGLGTWKIKSLWELSENENVTGELVAETITRDFKIPVVAWAEEPAKHLSGSNLISIIRVFFSHYKTNLSVGDRFSLSMFSFGIGNTSRYEIDLADTSFLRKKEFVDGDVGYEVSNNPPQNILSIFSNTSISEDSRSVLIKDATNRLGISESLGKVVEVHGAKIASIQKLKPREMDCLVIGSNKEEVESLSRIFSCETKVQEATGGYDFEIVIGSVFAKRY